MPGSYIILDSYFETPSVCRVRKGIVVRGREPTLEAILLAQRRLVCILIVWAALKLVCPTLIDILQVGHKLGQMNQERTGKGKNEWMSQRWEPGEPDSCSKVDVKSFLVGGANQKLIRLLQRGFLHWVGTKPTWCWILGFLESSSVGLGCSKTGRVRMGSPGLLSKSKARKIRYDKGFQDCILYMTKSEPPGFKCYLCQQKASAFTSWSLSPLMWKTFRTKVLKLSWHLRENLY